MPGSTQAQDGEQYDQRQDQRAASGIPRVDRLSAVTERIHQRVESVIEGKGEAVRLALTVLLAEGHLLIEDVPGVGKTMLAKALAKSIDCTVRRIQSP